MKKRVLFLLIGLLFYSLVTLGKSSTQTVIGNKGLKITVTKSATGAKVISIKYNNRELLDRTTKSTLFKLTIDKQVVTSRANWGRVSVKNDGTHCKITLSNPTNKKLAKTLKVTVGIDVTGKKSDWDIAVSGLGANSLDTITFPYINFLAPGNDYFLTPKYSGQLLKNPQASKLNKTLTYPRGWATTMQFCAYYNDNYGIYLGSHDPTAALKNFCIKSTKNGLLYYNNIYAPNRYEAGNDYKLPGTFCFELFQGNWYDAAQIYKKWAAANANYWPKDTKQRLARQAKLGNIAVWLRSYDVEKANKFIARLKKCIKFYDVPIGVHWYNWNHSYLDDNYPIYFPERKGMKTVIKQLKAITEIYFMPYINGRLFETNLKIYPKLGLPNATKKKNGSIYTSTFMGNKFAKMCPTQKVWQNIIADTAKQLTNRIGTDAVYVDQVTASMPAMCYDKHHGHPLGGGSYWRTGYQQMLKKMHNVAPADSFIVTEGCNDYLADVVDGFLTDGWTTANMVPAFQAVYSGKVQLLGTRFGTSKYGKDPFFTKMMQSFINGIQPGRFYVSILTGTTAKFVRQNAKLRNKFKEFMAFGTMLKPMPIDRSALPKITSTWKDYAAKIPVTISALQYSCWLNRARTKVLLLFGNASKSQSLKFKLNFNGADYGLNGKLKIRQIGETVNGKIMTEKNSFSKIMTLAPLEAYGLVITPESVSAIDK